MMAPPPMVQGMSGTGRIIGLVILWASLLPTSETNLSLYQRYIPTFSGQWRAWC